MISEGTHKAHGTDAALGYTSQDKEQVAIDFVLLEGEHEGSHITWYGSFSEKAMEHTFKALRLCGWQGDDLSDLTGCDANDVYLVIEHEDDLEGVPRARVRFVNGAGVMLKTRMDEGSAKAFAERMRGHAMASKQRTSEVPGTAARTPPAGTSGRQPAPAAGRGNAGRGRSTSQGERTPPPTDDDIPF